MTLDDITKELLRSALESHTSCAHSDPQICNYLILTEAALIRERDFEEDEELVSAQHFLADCVLEGLILKGLIQVEGMTEDGEFLIGLTDEGKIAEEEIRNDDSKESE